MKYFSTPYLSFPLVILTSKNAPFIGGIEDLYGKKLAVLQENVVSTWLKRDQINFEPYHIESPLKKLEAISFGKVDAGIENLATASYIIQKYGLTNVKIAAPTPYGNYNLHMAVRKDLPELLGVINKVIDSITPEQHMQIRSKWLSVKYDHGISKTDILKWIVAISVFLLTIIMVILIWNRKLKKEMIKSQKNEISLKNSEEKFKAAFQASPNAITLTSIDDGLYMDINDGFTKMLGYTQKDVIGKSSVVLNIWNDSKDREILVSELKKHGFIDNLEANFKGKDGQIRIGLMSACLLNIRNKGILLAVTQDITEMKQTEAALKKSEQQYRLMAENVADIIWTVDMSLDFTYISPSVYHQRGYTVQEAMEQSLNELLTPDSLEEVMDLFVEKIEFIEAGDPEGWEPVIFEAEQFCKDGTIITTSNNARILQGVDKQPRGILGVTRDITREKLAEKEKINAQKIAGEQKKLALVGQVAGKMAHDFNNILGIIMGNSELALLDCKDAQTRKTLELVFEQSLRGKNLTKNLITFAKSQEPKQEFFRINEKIDLVLNLMKKDLEGISIVKEDESNVADLLADPGMIEHALVNFVQNSIHAVSMVKNPKIIVRSFCLNNNICIEIEDNGCGIPEESLDRIYEPSFTLKGSRDTTGSYKPGIKGTGYGMSNIKKYIEQHKGNILVESEFGSGTKITISLPVIKNKLTSKEKSEIQEKTVHFEKHILLVEDEPAISGVQYRILSQEPCNHKVDIANNGQSAMNLYDRNKYDLVSLDYILPGQINGMDVYHHIRGTNKTIPILFISGNIEFLESIKKLKKLDQYVDHQSKPCINIDYVNSINKLFGNSGN